MCLFPSRKWINWEQTESTNVIRRVYTILQEFVCFCVINLRKSLGTKVNHRTLRNGLIENLLLLLLFQISLDKNQWNMWTRSCFKWEGTLLNNDNGNITKLRRNTHIYLCFQRWIRRCLYLPENYYVCCFHHLDYGYY